MSVRRRSPAIRPASKRGRTASRGGRGQQRATDEFSSVHWQLEDLRALASLTIGGDFSREGRVAITASLVEAKVDARPYNSQVIAAHRNALARNKQPPVDTGDDEIDGIPIVNMDSLQAQIALLQTQLTIAMQNKSVPVISPPPAPNPPNQGNDPLVVNVVSDKLTRIEKFAQDFAVQKGSVAKAADGIYTEVWELARYSVHRQTQAATSSTPGSMTFTTSSKKASLPHSFGDWSSQLGILENVRSAFAVQGSAADRFYVEFFRDTIWIMFTPLGVATMDRYVRMNAASKAIPWWPVPADVLTMALIFSLPHLQYPSFCNICGQINHSDSLCPLSDTLSPSSTSVPKQVQFASTAKPAPTKQPGPSGSPADISKVPCPHFMRLGAKGQCRPWKGTVCGHDHKCPFCKLTNKHKKQCART